jgi:predicted RNA-binding protein with RPS1 domain
MWLEDNDYLENEEQNALDEKASKVKISMGARSSAPTKEKKPRTTKVSDEKKALFAEILSNLEYDYKENVTVLKENKLIEVKMGGKTFKIDIIEQRPPKK